MGYLKLKRLTSTKTKNYLRYAFGEVFLVVMGILIALQVNNWNEKRKEKIDEKKILLSLHNEISSSLLNCNFVIKKKQDIISSAKEILSFTSPKGVWKSKYKLDSLIFHISNSGWRHVPQEGVLNELINSGKLSIVSDNILKTQISSLPKAYSQMIENDRINRLNIEVNINPFFYGKSILRNASNYIEVFEFSKTPLGFTKFNYSNNELLKNPKLEDILSYLSTYNKFGIEFLEKIKIKYLFIQKLIEEKYPDVNFIELDKDLDRGVWN